MFKLLEADKNLISEFRNKLIRENSRRFLFLLCFVALSQIAFIFLEALKILPWDSSVFTSRIIVFGLSVIFILFIYVPGRMNQNKETLLSLGIITSFIQFLSILVGCYFVIYMFSTGIYSYSAFLLVAFIVSLICIRNPYFVSVVLISFFVGLSAYLGIVYRFASWWSGEFLIALVFIFILCIGNVLNYNRHLKLFIQENEIEAMNRQLKAVSQTDELTGIYNRRKLLQVVDEYISLSGRYAAGFCMAILDIDHFKQINDVHGHSVGDVVLYQFANNIRFMLRSTDFFGRWGGDEFMILMPNCTENEAFSLMENLRISIEKLNFTQPRKITFSSGISSYQGELSSKEFIEMADRALYSAKNSGRNQTCVYSPDQSFNR